ncbi:glycosyltransferase [Streptomyces althioticus]|uniref:glycosyltransferase family 2 protein n=1 Tax=Streptomyces althioticus TaxID=83380 RepID=UPI00343EFA22
MTTISVLTAVHEGARPFLPAAYASLIAQELPPGWSWEWCIQEDGPHVSAKDVLPNDPGIHIGSSRKGGPAVTRTMAFARSTGSLIKVLDADDELTAGALARDIAVLSTDTSVGWTTSRVVDLMPDGSLLGFEGDPAPGVLPQGAVLSHWSAHRRPQVHPATLCARRDLVTLLGGWMALPASEDTGLLTALSVLAKGYFIPETGLRYRKHEAQSTAHPDHSSGEEWEARMHLIKERAEALTGFVKGEFMNSPK